MKMNKKTLSLVFIAFAVLFFSGCATTSTHYISEIPKNISIEDDDSIENYAKKDYSTITCSEGKTEITGLFGLGWSTPKLRLTFDTYITELDLFNSYHEAIRVAPATRNFTLKYTFANTYSHIKVRDFKFEPSTNYYVYYSRSGSKLSVWIEKEDGTTVFGSKPKEDTF